MIENEPFDKQLIELQRAFWENVGSDFANVCKSSSYDVESTDSVKPVVFQQWLNEIDKNWQDKATISSVEVDKLYKKLSSSSHFFANFTETLTSKKLDQSAGDLYQDILDGFKVDTPENNKHDVNNTWKNFSTIHQQHSLKPIITFFEDAAENPEFSEAVKEYLTALQKLQLIFFNLLKESTIQTVEKLNNDIDKLGSPKQIMFVCLEILEANYMLLIVEESYAKAYADVVNSWMTMLSKSNQTFADFIQSAKSTESSKSTANNSHNTNNNNHAK